MKLVINQNVEYANHTNSSTPAFSTSSASSVSLSNLIRDRSFVVNSPSRRNLSDSGSYHTLVDNPRNEKFEEPA